MSSLTSVVTTGAAIATAGFALERTNSGWGHLHHGPCGKWTSFLNPTDERVRWYLATHRCGRPETEWHLSEPAAGGHLVESPGAVAGWMRSLSRYLGTRPPELFTNSTVWPALQELTHTLEVLFPAALSTGRRP